jgi:hypothetical protein
MWVDEALAGLHIDADIGLSDTAASRPRGVHGRNEPCDDGGIGNQSTEPELTYTSLPQRRRSAT